MSLAEILERNRTYVEGRASRPLPPPESIRLAVIACYDPRLDALLGPALGIEDGQAFLIRSAGAIVAPAGDPLRSIALAAYLFDVDEVIVVGHTSCRMAAFEVARFIDAFRARGVARDAFGDADLRTWAGAIHDAAAGVRASVAALRAAPCLPPDLSVSGLLLDDASGALEVVVKPDEAVSRPFAPPPAAEEGDEAHPREHEKPAARAPAASDAGTRLLEAARAFADTVAAQAVWRYELQRLRTELTTHNNPITRVRLIDAFVRKAAADSREVAAALERLKREAPTTGRRLDDAAFVELIRRAFMGETS